MPRLAGFDNIARALKHPSYAYYAAGNVTALVGMWMQRVAVGWLTWQLTESPAWLGVMAFADLFPAVVCGPIAGAAADRWDRLKVIKIAQWLSTAQAVVLFALTAAGLITVEGLLALTVFKGFFAALHGPARLAIIPSLVPSADLPAAVAIGSISFNGAQFVGPALAGVVIVSHGVAGAFLANVATYVAFILALRRVRLGEAGGDKRRPGGGLFAALAEGIRYAAGHPGISSALILITAVALCARPFAELFPGYADVVFAAGARGLAILTSSVGAGAVVGGLWLAGRGEAAGLTRVVVLGVLGSALALLLFAATDRLWLAATLAFAAGFAMTAVGVGTLTMLQTSVDEAMRGRVMGLYAVLFRAFPAFGALVMGVASESFGLRWPVVGGAALTLLAFAWGWARRGRTARALETTGGGALPG